MNCISILIPARNVDVNSLVKVLHEQAERAVICYEMIVADDASDNDEVKAKNQSIQHLPHVRLMEFSHRQGRSAVRNKLWQAARYEWLLFIDGDMQIKNPDFLITYLNYISPQYAAICGDYELAELSPQLAQATLRYRYEQKIKHQRTRSWRQQHPYRAFRVCNLLIQRAAMAAHPFDEAIQRYGYEDLLLAKELQTASLTILHIDNPVLFAHFDSNEQFLRKTEIGLETLFSLRSSLAGLSTLLRTVRMLQRFHLVFLLRALSVRMLPYLRRNLLSAQPSLLFFKVYKFSYFLQIK